MHTIPIAIPYQGMLLTGYANTIDASQPALTSLRIYIKGWCLGTLTKQNNSWTMDQPIDPKFIEALGSYLLNYIRSVWN